MKYLFIGILVLIVVLWFGAKGRAATATKVAASPLPIKKTVGTGGDSFLTGCSPVAGVCEPSSVAPVITTCVPAHVQFPIEAPPPLAVQTPVIKATPIAGPVLAAPKPAPPQNSPALQRILPRAVPPPPTIQTRSGTARPYVPVLSRLMPPASTMPFNPAVAKPAPVATATALAKAQACFAKIGSQVWTPCYGVGATRRSRILGSRAQSVAFTQEGKLPVSVPTSCLEGGGLTSGSAASLRGYGGVGFNCLGDI